MASMTETVQVGVRQTIANAIYNTDSDETPVYALLSKGERPNGMLTSWQGEVYPDAPTTGIVDNTAATTPLSVPRYLIEAYCQQFRREWGVGYLATLSNVAGIGRNEAGRQMATAMIIHRIMVEKRILGIDEMQAESSPTPYEMRGALMWLLATAQSVKPVNAALRPASAQNLTTALASVTETIIKGALQSCYGERKAFLKLLGIVGADLRGVIDDFTNVHAVSSSTSQPRTMYAAKDASVYQNMVDFIKTSFGTVKIMTSPYIHCTEGTGAVSDYSPKSGLFIDPSQWEFCWLDEPANTNLAPDGSGKKGFVDGVGVLKCKNARGQFRLVSNS